MLNVSLFVIRIGAKARTGGILARRYRLAKYRIFQQSNYLRPRRAASQRTYCYHGRGMLERWQSHRSDAAGCYGPETVAASALHQSEIESNG